jgi:uncharacterized protein
MSRLHRFWVWLTQAPQWLLQGAVRGYRFWLKPWVGNSCRFEPSCSSYALQALQQHGALRGAALTGWRLLRCQPWCEGGCDPVPTHARNPASGLFTRLTQLTAKPERPQSATDFSSRKSP